MTEKPTNNIDDIFRSSIEPLETEPSEGFWIKASEDALFKSNLAKRSELNKWKTTAYIFGAAIIALAVYVIYSQEQISGIKKQLAGLQEKTAFQSSKQQAIISASPAGANNSGVAAPAVAFAEKKTTRISNLSAAVLIRA